MIGKVLFEIVNEMKSEMRLLMRRKKNMIDYRGSSSRHHMRQQA